MTKSELHAVTDPLLDHIHKLTEIIATQSVAIDVLSDTLRSKLDAEEALRNPPLVPVDDTV